MAQLDTTLRAQGQYLRLTIALSQDAYSLDFRFQTTVLRVAVAGFVPCLPNPRHVARNGRARVLWVSRLADLHGSSSILSRTEGGGVLHRSRCSQKNTMPSRKVLCLGLRGPGFTNSKRECAPMLLCVIPYITPFKEFKFRL